MKYRDLFAQSLDTVLEKSFFMLPEFIADEDLDEIIAEFEDQPFYFIRLQFGNDFKGGLEYYIPYNFALEMVCNSLGVSKEEVEEEMIEDDLREWTNMICGNFFTENFSHNNWDIHFSIIQKETFNKSIVLKDRKNWEMVKMDEHHFFYHLVLVEN